MLTQIVLATEALALGELVRRTVARGNWLRRDDWTWRAAWPPLQIRPRGFVLFGYLRYRRTTEGTP